MKSDKVEKNHVGGEEIGNLKDKVFSGLRNGKAPEKNDHTKTTISRMREKAEKTLAEIEEEK